MYHYIYIHTYIQYILLTHIVYFHMYVYIVYIYTYPLHISHVPGTEMTISEEFSKQNTAEVFYPVILGELRNQGWCIFLKRGAKEPQDPQNHRVTGRFFVWSYFHPTLRPIRNFPGSKTGFWLWRVSIKNKNFSCRPVGHLWVPEFFRLMVVQRSNIGYPRSETNKLYRTPRKKDFKIPTVPHTHAHFIVGFPWEKTIDHPTNHPGGASVIHLPRWVRNHQ